MKFSTMLKGIRKFFTPEMCPAFVCVALEHGYGGDAQPLLAVIHESIGCKTYEDKVCKSVMEWLHDNHPELYIKEFQCKPKAQQAYRLAWIDQMIAKFEAEGN